MDTIYSFRVVSTKAGHDQLVADDVPQELTQRCLDA
jgi:hypothetical protein